MTTSDLLSACADGDEVLLFDIDTGCHVVATQDGCHGWRSDSWTRVVYAYGVAAGYRFVMKLSTLEERRAVCAQ